MKLNQVLSSINQVEKSKFISCLDKLCSGAMHDDKQLAESVSKIDGQIKNASGSEITALFSLVSSYFKREIQEKIAMSGAQTGLLINILTRDGNSITRISWVETLYNKELMMGKILLLFFIISITGCGGGGSYSIKNSTDDQFADKSGPVIVTLEENHIDFKAPLGMVPTSQLIPYLFRDNRGNITEMGFHLINVRMSGGIMKSQERWLNIREGDELVFLADGKRVSTAAYYTRLDHYSSGYNSVTNSIDTSYFDYAWYKLTEEEMATVCLATSIKIQVRGVDAIAEYGTANRHSIRKAFYANNQKFFYEEILGIRK